MSFFTPINQAQEGISRSSRLETTEPAAVNEADVNNVADQEGGFMPAPVLQTQENYAYPPCPPLSAALLAYPRRPNPNLRLDYAVDAPFPRLAGTPLAPISPELLQIRDHLRGKYPNDLFDIVMHYQIVDMTTHAFVFQANISSQMYLPSNHKAMYIPMVWCHDCIQYYRPDPRLKNLERHLKSDRHRKNVTRRLRKSKVECGMPQAEGTLERKSHESPQTGYSRGLDGVAEHKSRNPARPNPPNPATNNPQGKPLGEILYDIVVDIWDEPSSSDSVASSEQ